MPVYRCTSCGRLLFRPENLLGRAWQCPSCGPTTVSDAAVRVNADVAAILEKEYRLSLPGSAEISTEPPGEEREEGLSPTPFRTYPRDPWGTQSQGQQDFTVPTAPRVLGLAGHVMCATILVISLLGAAGILWASWADSILQLVVLVIVGVPSLALIITMLVVIRGAILHEEKLTTVDEQLQNAPPPKLDWPAPPDPADATGRVQRKDDSVSPPAEGD
jgi:hypothetical protein